MQLRDKSWSQASGGQLEQGGKCGENRYRLIAKICVICG